MLGDNIKSYRKRKGMTQEELATRLHVVRQTVSKWEKGLSVPDAEMLTLISDELDCSSAELLGAEIESEVSKNELAEQLSRINEQLVIKNKRVGIVIKAIAIVIAVLLLIQLGLVFAGTVVFNSNLSTTMTSSISISETPIYSESEVKSAMEVVTTYFKKNYKGCNLKSINYDEDQNVSLFGDLCAKYKVSEVIIITTTFTTGNKSINNLNSNSIYNNYEWVLTRTGNGNWEIVNYGY